MDYQKGKLLLEQKVEDFYKNEKIYLDKTFQETENRTRFINPLFQSLGWGFDQTNISRQFWDVHQEFSQKDNLSTKKPDYAFRIDKKVKFFVEAKAPWVPLTDKGPVFQAKRYAFSTNGKAPIVILTDFQEFRVFNSLKRPIFDNPLQGLIKEFDLTYKDYLDKWDLLYSTFSKEAVSSGSLELLSGKINKATKSLDDEFLKDIVSWREILARNIAIRNKNLTVEEINEAVQRILDRLIFIRNLEDRNIQPENGLLNIAQIKDNIYVKLVPLFNKLDREYNGVLFKKHFSEEAILDDKILKDIIKSMCYPESPFQFDVIEPEILGRIYERFLGSKIRLTENHQAKVEEKPEVRHAGGVYYTPQFIVDYIVKNSVGKIINGLSPDEIKNIKILDPACGSGSFLIGAYDYLIKYHSHFYSEHKRNKKYKDDFFETHDGEIRLTLSKKGEILVNNIYGVDIDREATEVAMMSLYLKLLEYGFYEGQTLIFMKGHVLPDLENNIKRGNSLIDRDNLYENNMFGNANIEPFDWKDEKRGFGKIFDLKKGFDCVIGNPPYIRIQEMNLWYPEEASLYKKIFTSGSKGNFDIYVLFIEKGISLLNENGIFGMILPNKFFVAQYGEEIRDHIKQNVCHIVDFSDQQVFENATTYTNMLFITKKNQEKFKYAKIQRLENTDELFSKVAVDNEYKDDAVEIGFVDNTSLSEKAWSFAFGEDKEFFEKLSSIQTTLSDITINISQGFKTGSDKIFIHNFEKEFLEEDYYVKVLKGEDIQRYYINFVDRYSIFTYNNNGDPLFEKDFNSNASKIYDYLKNNKKELISRDNGNLKVPWFCFSRTQFIKLAKLPKIITRDLADKPSFAFDETGEYGLMGGYGILLKEGISYYYILGILNSSVVDKYMKKKSTHFRGGFYSYEARFIKNIPIYLPDEAEKEKFTLCQKIEDLAKQVLMLRKDEKMQADADFLEKKIDKLVEKIYFE